MKGVEVANPAGKKIDN